MGDSNNEHQIGDGDFERLDGFLLNAIDDPVDFRDYRYQPTLVQLRDEIKPPNDLRVLDQGREGACTGFGLAAVINLLLAGRGEDRSVSSRMLYEMAKKFDEWEGEDYSGSSCRGAIKGWHGMGVCSEDFAPYVPGETGWNLNIDQAKDARRTTLGAYYRVDRRLSDWHAALGETGALFASATVHDGWRRSNVQDGKIPYRTGSIGAHAFAVIGYNREGFIVQNSWGTSWGTNGLALWSYQDWMENVRDGWVMALGLSTPEVWHLTSTSTDSRIPDEGLAGRSPRRAEIVGHFVHIDDGDFDDKGRYWTNLETVRQTAGLIAKSDDYDHLLLYAHGGLNSVEASARRVAAFKEVFKDNRIYPFHFMYDTGLLEEIKDVVLGKSETVEERTEGFSDFTDRLIEKSTRTVGRAIWREMKSGAERPFDPDRAGTQTIGAFLDAFAQADAKPKKLHIAGHSTGAILLAALLRALLRRDDAPRIQTCALMAPACTHYVFNDVYRPLIQERSSGSFGITKMRIYNLDPTLELDDTVTPIYRKSLLYLVSNAFEERLGERILGMQKFRRYLGRLPGSQIFSIESSDGTSSGSKRTTSKTHGGFDNDLATMNDILDSIVTGSPARKFTQDDLRY